MAYSSWGHKESDITELLTHTFSNSILLLSIYPEDNMV